MWSSHRLGLQPGAVRHADPELPIPVYRKHTSADMVYELARIHRAPWQEAAPASWFPFLRLPFRQGLSPPRPRCCLQHQHTAAVLWTRRSPQLRPCETLTRAGHQHVEHVHPVLDAQGYALAAGRVHDVRDIAPALVGVEGLSAARPHHLVHRTEGLVHRRHWESHGPLLPVPCRHE